jgi:two-component system phosphate regulon sensor histidine kinase PhoR
MGTFELVPPLRDPRTPDPRERAELGSALLLQNARWFSRVRWSIVGVFALAGVIAKLFPGTLLELGVPLSSAGLWALAAVLAAANTAFHLVARGFPQDPPAASAKAFLWCQIFVDLVIVTLLVHIVGSTSTFIPFVYLFHVSMACIFFPKKESFLVTCAATILYLLTVLGELAGVWPSEGILSGPASIPSTGSPPALLAAGSAVFIWWVVWYFVSTLSEAVRRRDLELSVANERLLRADQEKNQHMLMTVHELKAPFAGIETTVDVLKFKHWESIPPAVRPLLERIDTQAQLLRGRINDILLLGDLKSHDRPPEPLGLVDVPELTEAVLKNVEQMALERRIQFDLRVPSMQVSGNLDRLTVLFTNLVANAVAYSPEGGTVEIGARECAEDVRVLVADHGIGIRDDALPHIFDEFYRTKEAARFNKKSTGLGLAIVKEIARRFRLRIEVTSESGKGTTFEVSLPKAPGTELK